MLHNNFVDAAPAMKGGRVGLLKRAMGRLLNTLGAPGFIRASECRERLGLRVEVRVNEAFTTISISNLRLLFHRLSGRFDGIIVESTDCVGVEVPEPIGASRKEILS